MKTILTIVKKELKKFFTDPRMVASLILPGLLIYGLYSVMGSITNKKAQAVEYSVYVENMPDSMNAYFDSLSIKYYQEELTKDEAANLLKDKKLDLYISFEEDFDNKVNNYVFGSDQAAPNIDVLYDPTETNSSTIESIVTSIFETYEGTLTNKFDYTSTSVASKEDKVTAAITMMLPFLLITLLFTGAMSICADSIAGEKERGTIASLLITPTKRSHIVLGKILALGITALTSACISAVGTFMSLPKLIGEDFSFSIYGPTTLILALIIIMVTVLLFTTILTMVSTYAKTVKEANSLSTPLMVVIMLISVSNFMSTAATTNLGAYFIPVYNVSQCLVQLFSLSINPITFVICILSNTVYIAIGVYILTKIFNNEHVIFNN